MKRALRLLFAPFSAALLVIALPLQEVKSTPSEVENSKIIAQASQNRQPRALEIGIFGIGPAVDSQAVAAVRSVIGRAVAKGVIDTYITYGYGIEGGSSSCIQLSPFQDSQKLRQLRSELLRIKPNPETTSYNVKAVAACTQRSSNSVKPSK